MGDRDLPPKHQARRGRENLIAAGVDVKLVADLLGSRAPLTTELYYARPSKSQSNAAIRAATKLLDQIKSSKPESK
jgi:hypothetical protein